MNVFKALADVPRIALDGAKAVSDAKQLVADITAIESSEAIKQAVGSDPVLSGALARISAEIRSLENDIADGQAAVADMFR